MKSTYSLKQLTFLKFLTVVVSQYKKMLVAIVFFTLLPLIVDVNWYMFLSILQFHVIFFGGLILSLVIHEYLHLAALKKNRGAGEVEIEFTLFKVSIYPKFKLTSKETIQVAILPSLILPVIGVVLILIAEGTDLRFILFTGYLYVFHVINIVPPMGDGMMIIKSIVNKNLKGGEKDGSR
jgi:hypothetical protein